MLLSDLNERDPSEAPYLSDSYGRSITPLIAPELLDNIAEKTDSEVGCRGGRLPAKYNGPDIDTATRFEVDKDQRRKHPLQLLKTLERHRLAVGLTMEQDGAILASDDARIGFLDDEDFQDIIEDGASDDEVYEMYRGPLPGHGPKEESEDSGNERYE